MTECPQCGGRYDADEHTDGPCRECRHENHAAALSARCDRLRARETALVKALEWYANERHYRGEWTTSWTAISSDKGECARKALANLDEG